MSNALSSGVTGLQSHQKMLDVAGSNLANVNTTAYKTSRVNFAELLNETLKRASQPTTTVGGTNPQQIGSGVGLAGITPNMTQGNIVNTGNPLDLAIEGEGYFVLNDGGKDLYTRAGVFAVDADSNLIDPATGYLVQRIGSTGEADGFQTAGDSNIHVPYDVSMAANATTSITLQGNLSSDNVRATAAQEYNTLLSDVTYTTASGTTADGSTDLDDLDQFTAGTLDASSKITVTGFEHDGTALVDAAGLTVTAATDMDALIAHINTVIGASGTASLVNGRIQVKDASTGYSLSDVKLTFTNPTGTADFEDPAYFEVSTIGGDEVKNVSITTYDSLGGKHVLSAAFVRTDTSNTWDLVLTSLTGDVYDIDIVNGERRIRDIEFDANDGSFSGLNAVTGDTSDFKVTFDHDTSNEQTIAISLGSTGQLDGITQFAGNSTAVAREQDGYESGSLASVSVNNEGIIIGAFSNGIKKNLATLQIALFQNPAALERIGNGYNITSANSGDAITTS
ncbi:MAG: flagellar hook-basal body complex protein, partial [Planctomycetota bacterium]